MLSIEKIESGEKKHKRREHISVKTDPFEDIPFGKKWSLLFESVLLIGTIISSANDALLCLKKEFVIRKKISKKDVFTNQSAFHNVSKTNFPDSLQFF